MSACFLHPPTSIHPPTHPTTSPQAVIIITVTRFLSLGTKFLKQPRVIMEVVGGILLGRWVGGWVGGWVGHIYCRGMK